MLYACLRGRSRPRVCGRLGASVPRSAAAVFPDPGWTVVAVKSSKRGPSKGFDPQRLEHYRAVIGPGPSADEFKVPPGLVVETRKAGLRFRGDAAAILRLEDEFSKLARSESGDEVRVEGWVLRVQDEVPADDEPECVVMPWHAWWMAGHLFSDVAYGYYNSPFDFSDVGYICFIAHDGTASPCPSPDIGVILDGPIVRNRH